MIHDFIQPLAETYANFFIWAFGGVASAEVWLLSGAVGIGVVLMFLPFYFTFDVVDQRREYERGRGEKPATWKIWASFLGVPGFFFGLFICLVLGINGGMAFQSNFHECVQIEDRTVDVPQTVMVLMCRDRDNTSDQFGAWYFEGLQHNQKFMNWPEVESLPEVINDY